MRYEDTTRRHHEIPVTLSSVKCRRQQNITLELRSAGPLIGPCEKLLSTHSIEVHQTKSDHCTTTHTQQTKRTFESTDSESIINNFKEVILVIDNVESEDEDYDNGPKGKPPKNIPSTTL